jgi:hypothetical protein
MIWLLTIIVLVSRPELEQVQETKTVVQPYTVHAECQLAMEAYNAANQRLPVYRYAVCEEGKP